ncbi:class I SAM-dependent methyltransferase [Paenibacillus sp. RC67]|uniref:class I SAM-dependent methyltransferase n=1 Tax=Paenibacillus sp. RC67 TaxID=3039392 RepID=UPI0024AE46DC|nr:class I SAM-dependent methyltransferase [Paenibacillus sp. RC67]
MKSFFHYYLALKNPDAGEWNGSPACIYTELVTRDYIRKSFAITDGLQLCNVGIGTGDWDDYLGYWLNGKGSVTSIDIDSEICELFAYRQQREGHPNPSKVVCESILESCLPKEQFDIVTLSGSTVRETGDFCSCLDACIGLLKQGGSMMFMAGLKYTPIQMLEPYIANTAYRLEGTQIHEAYPEYPFYICTIRK